MTEATQLPQADASTAPPQKKKQNATLHQHPGPKAKEVKTTKAGAVIALLSRPKGASLDDMMKATGWQAHSVRGFMAGTVKKKLGRTVTSEVTDKGRVWRIDAGAAK